LRINVMKCPNDIYFNLIILEFTDLVFKKFPSKRQEEAYIKM
jgi:hypothetical protein